jgi:hypothetical protein
MKDQQPILEARQQIRWYAVIRFGIGLLESGLDRLTEFFALVGEIDIDGTTVGGFWPSFN